MKAFLKFDIPTLAKKRKKFFILFNRLHNKNNMLEQE